MSEQTVAIKPPSFGTAIFTLKGEAPLVVHRFSAKAKNEMKLKMEAGKTARSKKIREAKSTDSLYEEAKYVSKDGWEGINATALRKAMISACRLVEFKMSLAKLSVFIIPDGYDAKEPQVPLIRIYGESVKQEDIARVQTGQPYVTVRAAYHNWELRPQIRWDQEQFTLQDITNLLARVGLQVGLCEGRPDSKNSAGLGWGLFSVPNVAITKGELK